MIATSPIPHPTATPHESRRGIALERLVRIAQTLRRLRFGLSLVELAREISEQTEHPWHVRTICRDCNLLEYLNLVEVENNVAKWISAGDLFDVPPQQVRVAADFVSRESVECWQARRDRPPAGRPELSVSSV